MNKLFQTSLPSTVKIAGIVRHAERYPINLYKNALEAPLTKNGTTDAYIFGKQLYPFLPLNLYHSPVPRCRETAEYVLKGIDTLSEKPSAIQGPLLELGGPYIKGDWNIIVKKLDKLGQASFLRLWFNNKLPDELLTPLDKAAKQQLHVLLNQLQHNTKNTINVSHDWNIAILREYYFNVKHEDYGMPDYLDGIYTYLKDDAVIMNYHEYTKVIPIDTIDNQDK